LGESAPALSHRLLPAYGSPEEICTLAASAFVTCFRC